MVRTTTTRQARSRTTPVTGRKRSHAPRVATALRRPAVASPKNAGIQRFLDRFTTALTAGDGETVAHCFEYPSVMVMSDPQKYGPGQVLDDPQNVAGFFANAPQQYHDKGIEQTFASMEDVQWLNDDLCLVRARFPYLDAQGNDMGDGESSAYILRRSGPDYSICAAVTLGTDSDRGRSRTTRSTVPSRTRR